MKAKETWKPVTIGGLTGIMMGAGTMYAVKPSTSVGNTENNMVTSDNVSSVRASDSLHLSAGINDDMSFNEAFATARAEVGSGGLFNWRGNVYGTYTADEWNAMSDEDKNLFVERASSAVRHTEPETQHVTGPEAEEIMATDSDVRVTEESVEHEVSVEKTPYQSAFEDVANADVTSWNDIVCEENDVRVVGFKEIELEHGHSVVMQELDVNGQRVAIIDVDKDGLADLAMTDLNHNRQMDEGEVIDLQTGEALTFANDESSDDSLNGSATVDEVTSDIPMSII